MSDHQHYADCYLHHFPCALIELRRLQVENAKLESGLLEPDWMRRIREGGMVDTQSGHTLTHKVTLTLHTPEGPTWAHAVDEPPSR